MALAARGNARDRDLLLAAHGEFAAVEIIVRVLCAGAVHENALAPDDRRRLRRGRSRAGAAALAGQGPGRRRRLQ